VVYVAQSSVVPELASVVSEVCVAHPSVAPLKFQQKHTSYHPIFLEKIVLAIQTLHGRVEILALYHSLENLL
jgi:hypothetical protein